MFSIGEFSKITGPTIKTLRFYHDNGLLVPSRVDPDTGYRWYAESKVEVARVISELRKLEFPLSDIAEILDSFEDEGNILEHLERRKATIDERLRQYGDIGRQLDSIITSEREARSAMQSATYEVEESMSNRSGLRASACGEGTATAAGGFRRSAGGSGGTSAGSR